MNMVFTHSYRVLATSNSIPPKKQICRFGQVIIHYFTNLSFHQNTTAITIKQREGEFCPLKIGSLKPHHWVLAMMAPRLGWDLMWHWPSAKGKSLQGWYGLMGPRPPTATEECRLCHKTMETSKKIHWLFVRLGHIKITLYPNWSSCYSCYIYWYHFHPFFDNKHDPISTIHVADPLWTPHDHRWGAFKTGLVIGSEGLTRLATRRGKTGLVWTIRIVILKVVDGQKACTKPVLLMMRWKKPTHTHIIDGLAELHPSVI